MINERKSFEAIVAEQEKNPIDLARLWEYRNEFYEIPEEVVCEHPVIAVLLVKILYIEGRPKAAEKYLEYIKKEPLLYDYICLVNPILGRREFRRIVEKRIRNTEEKLPKLILTAGRPSILNGFRDFTEYGKYLKQYKEPIVRAIQALYGEAATGVYEIALAEYLYYKNECFEALVLTVGAIPFMENMKDVRCLFAALTLEMYILVANGQAASVEPLMANVRSRLVKYGSEELEHNLEALNIWTAMYDGKTELVNRWMKDAAPDEYTDFNTVDTFRYMIKLRCYLIQEKHMALFSLAERMRPLLETGHRKMDMCELSLVLAMSFHAQEKKMQAFDLLEQALKSAEKYGYDRLIADEGIRMYKLLLDYRRERSATPYLTYIMNLTRKMGLLYPNYLKVVYEQVDKITDTERDVLRLMAEEKSNNEISEYMDISLNTVKFHSKNLFRKLGVSSRGRAVKKAREIGILI